MNCVSFRVHQTVLNYIELSYVECVVMDCVHLNLCIVLLNCAKV